MKSQQKPGQYTLTKNQVSELYNAPTNFRDRVIIKTLYWGGLRRMEVINLNVPDIDFNMDRITVFQGKGQKTRTVPILDMDFRSDLSHHIGKRTHGSVFVSQRGTAISSRQLNQIVVNAGKQAKLRHPNPFSQNINPHLLRHSIARHLKSDGYMAEWIQNFLGHSSIKVTMDTYGTLGIEEMQRVAQKKYGLVEQAKRLGYNND